MPSTGEAGELRLAYTNLGLPPAYLKALERLDLDNSGDLSLSEVIQAESLRHHGRSQQALWLGTLSVVVVLACTFGASYWNQSTAQTTALVNGALVAAASGGSPGGQDIFRTAQAWERFPLAWAPLLTLQELRRVKEMEFSDMQEEGPGQGRQPCVGCPAYVIVRVDLAYKSSQNRAQFVAENGCTVVVDSGTLVVYNLPDANNATKPYYPCASFTCSAVYLVGGASRIDRTPLAGRAAALGYAPVT